MKLLSNTLVITKAEEYNNAVMTICIANAFTKFKAELYLLNKVSKFDIDEFYSTKMDKVTGGQ